MDFSPQNAPDYCYNFNRKINKFCQLGSNKMKKILPFLIMALLVLTCNRDNRERLFEMVYPNFRFDVIPGGSSFLPRVVEFNSVATNIDFYLDQSNTDPELITGINPYSARIYSLDGNEFQFVEEISVRICPDGPDPCTPADEAFYIDNLQNRGDEVVELLPTLRNVKNQMLERTIKTEIVFFLRYPPPTSIESAFDMTFEAVK